MWVQRRWDLSFATHKLCLARTICVICLHRMDLNYFQFYSRRNIIIGESKGSRKVTRGSREESEIWNGVGHAARLPRASAAQLGGISPPLLTVATTRASSILPVLNKSEREREREKLYKQDSKARATRRAYFALTATKSISSEAPSSSTDHLTHKWGIISSCNRVWTKKHYN